MKLVVLGASGRTGREVVVQAVAAGWDVTAVAREGSAVPPGAEVVRAGLTDAGPMLAAVRGADAVVSALGATGRGPTTVCTDGVTAAVRAMREAGVRRLAVVSAAALPGEGEDRLTRWMVRPILTRVLRNLYADLAVMEQVVRDSGLEWTIVRPPMLTDGPRTDTYRQELDRHVYGGRRIARADVAAELLRVLGDDAAVGRTVAIAD